MSVRVVPGPKFNQIVAYGKNCRARPQYVDVYVHMSKMF